jgi:hypothetical protein
VSSVKGSVSSDEAEVPSDAGGATEKDGKIPSDATDATVSTTEKSIEDEATSKEAADLATLDGATSTAVDSVVDPVVVAAPPPAVSLVVPNTKDTKTMLKKAKNMKNKIKFSNPFKNKKKAPVSKQALTERGSSMGSA